MDTAPFACALQGALRRRVALVAPADVTAWRVLDGKGDGVRGLSIDRYGPVAVMNVYDDAGLPDEAVTAVAGVTLDQLAPLGVESVYVKPFVRDRSRLGGALGDEATSPVPRAGVPQPDALVVEEYGTRSEVRMWDGLSTGLFLDHRDRASGPRQFGFGPVRRNRDLVQRKGLVLRQGRNGHKRRAEKQKGKSGHSSKSNVARLAAGIRVMSLERRAFRRRCLRHHCGEPLPRRAPR